MSIVATPLGAPRAVPPPVTAPAVATPTDPDAIAWGASVPFLLVHLAAIAGIFVLGVSVKGVLFALGSYYFRMFWVTAGYHRYFSHKTFETGRVMQFLFAFFAQTSSQKGALWWAAHHRHHHRYSDKEQDVHSMKRRGFLYSHVGWILSRRWNRTEVEKIPELVVYPELRFLDRFHVLPVIVYAAAWALAGGMTGFVWGFLVGTVLLWHGTFTINSLSHWLGAKRYKTMDESRNSAILALVTLGEGWHNNHHFYCKSTRQGFYWWEIDVTYYVLRAMAAVGLVRNLHEPPAHVLALGRGEVRRRPAPAAPPTVA